MAYAPTSKLNYLKAVSIYSAWADQLEELKTICYCGRKANFVLRLNEQGGSH